MMVYYLLVCVLGLWINPVISQFYYSSFAPLPYTSLYPQPFLPTYIPQPLQVVPQTRSSVSYNGIPSLATQNQATSSSSVTYSIPAANQNQLAAPSSAEYRGFGYRTDYQDGATSTVFFVTGGPEGINLRNFPNLANFKINSQNAPATTTAKPTTTSSASQSTARNLASNILDNNALIGDIHSHIRNILEPAQIQTLFDNANTGAFHFYTYPAGTVPLVPASRSLNENISSTSSNTESSTETATESSTEIVTTTTPAAITSSSSSSSEEIEAEGAESIIENRQAVPLSAPEEGSESTASSSSTTGASAISTSTETTSSTSTVSTTETIIVTPEASSSTTEGSSTTEATTETVVSSSSTETTTAS